MIEEQGFAAPAASRYKRRLVRSRPDARGSGKTAIGEASGNNQPTASAGRGVVPGDKASTKQP